MDDPPSGPAPSYTPPPSLTATISELLHPDVNLTHIAPCTPLHLNHSPSHSIAHFYYVSSESGSFGLAEVRLTEPNNVKNGKFAGTPKVTLTELAQLPSPSRVAIAQVSTATS